MAGQTAELMYQCAQAYFDVLVSLTILDEPIFKGQLLVVPTVMRKQLIEEIHSNHTLLVISDYYSSYIEVAHLTTTTSRSVIKEMKVVFARFGVPDTIITDNGPQFSSAEFAVFAKMWMFEHKTSSPTYPQSNGTAENAVKTVKRLSPSERKPESQSSRHY